MKNIMIIIDGMNDDILKELDNMTPYEYAAPKHMKYMKSKGLYGLFKTCPDGFTADSLCCILTLLGQDKIAIPLGRAYLEALSENIQIQDDEFVMRCNLVSFDKEGILTSSTGGSLKKDEYNKLALDMRKSLTSGIIKMHHMGSYKNLLVIKKKYINEISDFPPHQNIGKNIKDLVPMNKILQKFVSQSINVLNNKEKKYAFLPWGLSMKENLPSFNTLHEIKAASVCHTEIVRGICIAMKMDTPKMMQATADIDTNLKEKANLTIKLMKDNDFILVHINGADEASHRKNPLEKSEFIKKIDQEIIGTLLKEINEEYNILITSDHSTLCKTGSHRGDLQPFILFNSKFNKHEDLGVIDGKEAVALMKKFSL
ncbi:MAG: alkaline phosphatase family protein [Clostridium sp.]|nr:alkaline phosphatase family protein [Clostridium sp.]